MKPLGLGAEEAKAALGVAQKSVSESQSENFSEIVEEESFDWCTMSR